jgi:predicted PurR-regulated permease PerM
VLRRGCDIVDNADTTAGGAPPSFTARVLRVLALTTLFVAAALLLWVAADIVLLAFIGFLLAVALATPASAIARRTGMPRWLALLLVALAILALLAGGAWFAGDQIVQQIVGLIEDLPAIAERLRDTLERVPGGDWLRDQLEDVEPMGLADLDLGLVGQVTGSLAALFEVLVRITFVVFFALFLASAPQRYRDGLVRLSPPASQARAREVYDQIAVTMQGWIVGQLASMLLVGILATVGLLVIGVPYALLLGLLAGLAELIPIFGPIFAYIPAAIVALLVGPQQLLWVTILYLVIQQLEGNLIQPMVQRHAVDLPRPLTIVAILLGASVFGVLGMFVATPLMAIALVLVKMLYLHDTLGQTIELPGGNKEESPPKGSRPKKPRVR